MKVIRAMSVSEANRKKTLYPVCSWEENQHKLYNAHDRIMNAICEARESGEDEEPLYRALENVERVLDAFNKHVIQGIVYATYEDSCLIMDYVAAYNARH